VRRIRLFCSGGLCPPTARTEPRCSRATEKTDGWQQRNAYNDRMSTTAEKVVTAGMGLSPSLRAFVAEKLIESLDTPSSPPLSAKWRKEIRRRCAEMDRSEVKLRDADAVFAKAYAALP